jgi:hypothetical protein
MNLHVLQIPEGHVEVARWLEHKLVSMELSELVAELTALDRPGDSGRPLTLDQTLHKFGAEIFDEGLSGLPEEVVRSMLQSPELLLGLQEQILLEGSAYWIELSREVASAAALQGVWQTAIKPELGEASTRPVTPPPPPPPMAREKSSFSVRNVAMLGTALALLVAVIGSMLWFEPGDETQPIAVANKPWGWSSPDALQFGDQDRAAIFRSLAKGADAWDNPNKTPRNRKELATRGREFLQGCNSLIDFAETVSSGGHDMLTKEDGTWLVEKCKLWRKDIEGPLETLTDNNFGATQGQLNQAAKKFADKFRERADEIDAGLAIGKRREFNRSPDDRSYASPNSSTNMSSSEDSSSFSSWPSVNEPFRKTASAASGRIRRDCGTRWKSQATS